MGGSTSISIPSLINVHHLITRRCVSSLSMGGSTLTSTPTTFLLYRLASHFSLTTTYSSIAWSLAIARSKDIIAQFDINMIPKKWDMDKFMYFVEGTGIAWVDYNKEGIQLSPQHQSVLDMSIKTISQYLQLLESIMQEWEKISGVNRQRQGGIGPYEGKAASQQAIVQSSHITEDLFRKFARFEQRELQGLLDYSKEAWLTGKKAMYVMPDMTIEMIDIDCYAAYGK